MPEDFTEDTPAQFDPGRYLDLVRRRHMHFLLPLLFGWLAIWSLSWFLPARYKSATLILVEQPAMPKNYVIPNINDDLQEQLQSIQQQILSRTRLLVIIHQFHLYQNSRHPLTADEQVDRMRKDIGDVELVRDPQEQITAFRISYSAATPKLAQEVTGELTNLFITENLKNRQQQSEQTTSFIQQQLKEARQNLTQQDAKVRAFEAAHQGELPAQQASNLQILSGLQAQLQNEQDALNTARQQRAYYQSLIAQYRSVPGHVGAGGPNNLSAIDQQLQTLRAQLTDYSARYTDEYPGVQALKEQIAKLEQQRDRVVAQMRTAAANSSSDGGATLSTLDATQATPLLQLQGQLRANEIEIANREHAIRDLTARISSYQSRLNAEPGAEQEMADLTRGYEQSQANYNDLLKKEQDSEMATSMEQMQQGERFTLLDPPSLPSKPDFPNRLKFCGLGLLVGLALGSLAVAGLEVLDDRLRTNNEIEELLLPVGIITEVPQVLNRIDEQKNRRETVLGWSMAALVFAVILAGSAFSFIHA